MKSRNEKGYDGVERRNRRRVHDEADIARRWERLRKAEAALEEYRRQNYEPVAGGKEQRS